MQKISAALVKAQKAFGPALKSHTNPAFKSKYADLAACVEAVVDALNNAGIALIQHCHPSDKGVTVETVFVHESGETLSCGQLSLPASKQDPQGYGSALTYARRYSLMAACGIAPEDDDGNAASKPRAVQPIKHAPRDGIGEELAPDVKASLQDLADQCTQLVIDGLPAQAFKAIEDQGLEADQKTWLWGRLDAKTRAAIKLAKDHPQLDKVKELA